MQPFHGVKPPIVPIGPNFRDRSPYLLGYASEPHPPPPSPAPDLHDHRRPDIGHRHRRQCGDFQRDRRGSPQAAAVPARRRAGRARSDCGRPQPSEDGQRAVPVFHLPRGRTTVPGRRPVDQRHGERDRPCRTRGSAVAGRDRWAAPDAWRDSRARPPHLESGRHAGLGGGHGALGRLLAHAVWQRPVGRRAAGDGERKAARDRRRPAGHLFLPRQEAFPHPAVASGSVENVPWSVQLHRGRASEARRHRRAGQCRSDATDSDRSSEVPAVPRLQHEDVRGSEAAGQRAAAEGRRHRRRRARRSGC